MKRIKIIKKIIIVLSIIVLCSCSINVNYNFDKDFIDSNIEANFTLKEFYEYDKVEEDGENNVTDSMIESRLNEFKESVSLEALDNEPYKEDYFKKENNNYIDSYSYRYNYDNFINNTIFNNCFDKFEYTEDETYYNIRISGNYLCEPKITINIKSSYDIEKSNSISINNNIHSWKVYETDNEIMFSLRKVQEKNEKISTTFRKIGFIVIIILIVIGTIGIIFSNKIKDLVD